MTLINLKKKKSFSKMLTFNKYCLWDVAEEKVTQLRIQVSKEVEKMGSQYSPRSQTEGMHWLLPLARPETATVGEAYEKHLKVQA